MKLMKSKTNLVLVVILLFGFFLRTYGINWDQGQHLHPDERFLTMVVSAMKVPESLTDYFNPALSTLNPANIGYKFFVYGTLPLFLVKGIGAVFALDNYNGALSLGRFLSAFFDTLTILFIYKIIMLIPLVNVKLEQKKQNVALLSAFIYSIMVLPLQLSHYFAVETFMVFFLITSLFCTLNINTHHPNPNPNKIFFWIILSGILFGFAMATKISSVFFAPVIGGILIWSLYTIRKSIKKQVGLSFISLLLVSCLLFLISCYFSLRLTDPYMFEFQNVFNARPSSLYLNNLKQLKSWEGSETTFPPAIQWITQPDVIFPARNLLYYGIGIPLTILLLTGYVTIIINLIQTVKHKKKWLETIPFVIFCSWSALLFIYLSTQFVKPMRYFILLFPVFALFSSLGFFQISNFKFQISRNTKITGKIFSIPLLVLSVIWSLMFLRIYATTNTRIEASQWIYKNIPAGSTITCEHWDDCLPLRLPTTDNRQLITYDSVQLNLYDPDTPEKWTELYTKLENVDYIILTSNRLFGSIPTIPDRYPQTTEFYRKLFNGELGFTPVAQFTSRPTLPLPFVSICVNLPGENYGYLAKIVQRCNSSGISIVDDYADESYTVYDHPKVIILKKTMD
jgi:4-amino-4-deoxy-L-arabinose transferase-like glycosyltransferase